MPIRLPIGCVSTLPLSLPNDHVSRWVARSLDVAATYDAFHVTYNYPHNTFDCLYDADTHLWTKYSPDVSMPGGSPDLDVVAWVGLLKASSYWGLHGEEIEVGSDSVSVVIHDPQDSVISVYPGETPWKAWMELELYRPQFCSIQVSLYDDEEMSSVVGMVVSWTGPESGSVVTRDQLGMLWLPEMAAGVYTFSASYQGRTAGGTVTVSAGKTAWIYLKTVAS